ncbi:MAG: hypothetical protein KDA87_09085 [Planctomycetales bacterium]|nr:hypothetical protein [Planctomycetales bacterium]
MRTLLAVTIVFLTCNFSCADLVISATGFPLLPNTANQQVQLNVNTNNSDNVAEISLFITIGDGGMPDGGTTGSDVAGVSHPFITDVNFDFAGSIFQNESMSALQSANDGLIVSRTAFFGSMGASVLANGPLAIVTISTVGAPSGDFDFLLNGVGTSTATGPGSTAPAINIDFGQSVSSGSIAAVPEPSAFLLLGLISVGTVLGRWSVKKFLVHSC